MASGFVPGWLARRLAVAAELAVAVALGAPLGCAAGNDGRQCNVHADCASGFCNPDGTCAPMPSGGAGAGGQAAGGGAGAFGGSGQGGSGEAGLGGCHPDGDLVITAAELPFGPGFSAMFRVSENVAPFSSAPDCGSGTCVWDLLDLGGTTYEEQTTTEPIAGKWYAQTEGFEQASYASHVASFRLGLGGLVVCEQEQFGVFQVTSTALLLLGLVSEYEDEGTRLVYDPPVPVLQYPMTVGTTWSVDTTASGPLCNSVFDYHIDQSYASEVDRVGTVLTPYGELHNVLRVNTYIQRHIGVGVLPTEARTHTFVAECFTSVAAVMSPEGVAEADFDEAALVRRLSLLP